MRPPPTNERVPSCRRKRECTAENTPSLAPHTRQTEGLREGVRAANRIRPPSLMGVVTGHATTGIPWLELPRCRGPGWRAGSARSPRTATGEPPHRASPPEWIDGRAPLPTSFPKPYVMKPGVVWHTAAAGTAYRYRPSPSHDVTSGALEAACPLTVELAGASPRHPEASVHKRITAQAQYGTREACMAAGRRPSRPPSPETLKPRSRGRPKRPVAPRGLGRPDAGGRLAFARSGSVDRVLGSGAGTRQREPGVGPPGLSRTTPLPGRPAD